MHIHTPTHAHTHTYACTHAHLRMHAHTYAWTRTHLRMHARTHIYINDHLCNRRFRKRWRRPQILQFCGDDRRIRQEPRPNLDMHTPYTSVVPAKMQDLRPSPSFAKSSMMSSGMLEYPSACKHSCILVKRSAKLAPRCNTERVYCTCKHTFLL